MSSPKADALLAHAEFVRRLARSLVTDEHRVDDVVQETFLASLRWPQPPGSGARGWLGTVARNAARMVLRADRRRRHHEHAAARPEATPSPVEMLSRAELHRAVVDAVNNLRFRGHDVIVYQVLDRAEIEFDFDESATYEDLETGASVPVVPGRMQRFGGVEKMPLVVVDYAHTPDALSAALLALRDHCKGRLWCVFGCGGDRDEGKRSQMGAIADELADVLVLTNDNPRSEDGEKIIAGIMRGVARKATAGNGLFIEQDRAAAIRFAVVDAGMDDVVLVAGKGHEAYQETMGARRPFSDAAAVRSALEARRSC